MKNNNFDVNELVNEINFEDNKISGNSHLNLTNYQISILDRYNIDYSNIKTLNDLIHVLNTMYQYTEDEEIDILLDELSERDYYENTKK